MQIVSAVKFIFLQKALNWDKKFDVDAVIGDILALYTLALFPDTEEGDAWYTLFAHACNYSEDYVAELEVLLV